MNRLQGWFTLGVLAFLSGCVSGPDYHAPVLKVDDQWHAESTKVEVRAKYDDHRWWEQLNDPWLSKLMDEAMRNNQDVRMAMLRLEKAKILRHNATQEDWPTLDASAGASRNRFSKQTGFGANTGIRNTFSASLDASWEVDLFGKDKRTHEAAIAQFEATEAASRGVMLAMQAELASNYFEMRGFQRQRDATLQDIALLKEVEGIAKLQRDAGSLTDFEWMQAKGEREAFEAKLPNIESEITARIYRISVLTQKAPEFYQSTFEKTEPLPMPADLVPVGLRSDMLKRRPDLQQAERELAVATANIGIAHANLFPSFALTGSVGSSARLFTDLLTPATMISSLGSSLGWPLFHNGDLVAQEDMAKVDAKIALINYEQAVLLALEDAEGSLMRYGKGWQTLTLLRQAEATRLHAVDLAKFRYEVGEESLLTLLDAKRAWITSHNATITSETQLLLNLTQLYKSLGGGWQGVVEPLKMAVNLRE